MVFISRDDVYNSYEWENPFHLLQQYIIRLGISNRDVFYWDGVEQLQVPFVWNYDDKWHKYYVEFQQFLDKKNINIFAVGGDFDKEPPPGKRIKTFRWKTALLHFINHSIVTEYKSDDVRIVPSFNKLFNCLNRHPRHERVLLVDSLYKHNLFPYGDVSWNMLQEEWIGIEPINSFKYWKEERRVVDIVGHYETGANNGIYKNDGTMYIRDYQLLTDYLLNSNCLFNITTESVSNAGQYNYFITEKTWKPILLGQPNFVVGNYWYKEHMTNLGFKFYDNIVDYSFCGNYESNYEEYEKITDDFAKELSKLKDKNYQEIYESIKDVVEYNRDLARSIIDNDPHITQDFIDFYLKHKNDWDSCEQLKQDIDIHKVFKNKI